MVVEERGKGDEGRVVVEERGNGEMQGWWKGLEEEGEWKRERGRQEEGRGEGG